MESNDLELQVDLGTRRSRYTNLGFSVNNQFIKFLDFMAKDRIRVDKSLLIKELIESPYDGSYLITRPRRWGKTTALQMIESFFMFELDDEGNPEKTVSLMRRKTFERLNIGKEIDPVTNESYIDKYMGKLPIIMINMMSSCESWFDAVGDIMSQTFAKFLYIYRKLLLISLKSAVKLAKFDYLTTLTIEELEDKLEHAQNVKKVPYSRNKAVEIFKRIYRKESNLVELTCSLRFLCNIVRDHFKKEVCILVDEYDYLFTRVNLKNSLVQNEGRGTIQELADLKGFMRGFYGTNLKSLDSLKLLIICGISSVSLTGIWSDANFLTKSNLQGGPFSEYFGFTQEEVETIVQTHFTRNNILKKKKNSAEDKGLIFENIRYVVKDFEVDKSIAGKNLEIDKKFAVEDLEIEEIKDRGQEKNESKNSESKLTKDSAAKDPGFEIIMEKIKNYYNGYRIGNHKLYNPFSIMRFLENCGLEGPDRSFKQYWCFTGDPTEIFEYIKSIKRPINELAELMRNGEVEVQIPEYLEISHFQTENIRFFGLIFETGYITKHDTRQNVYVIPNMELKLFYYEGFLSNVLQNLKILDSNKSEAHVLERLTESLEDCTKYETAIAEIIIPALFHLQPRTEDDFKGYLNSISFFNSLVNRKPSPHKAFAEVYTKDGKITDGLFLPIVNKSTVAIIHEYKIATNLNNAEKQLIEATWQILANHYIQHIVGIAKTNEGRHIKSIIARSVVFYGGSPEPWQVLMKSFNFQTIDKAQEIYVKIRSKFEDPSILIGGTKKNKEALKNKEAARLELLSEEEVGSVIDFFSKYTCDFFNENEE